MNPPFPKVRIWRHCFFIYFYFSSLPSSSCSYLAMSSFKFFRYTCSWFSFWELSHIVYIIWVKLTVFNHCSSRSSCIFSFISCSGSFSIIAIIINLSLTLLPLQLEKRHYLWNYLLRLLGYLCHNFAALILLHYERFVLFIDTNSASCNEVNMDYIFDEQKNLVNCPFCSCFDVWIKFHLPSFYTPRNFLGFIFFSCY